MGLTTAWRNRVLNAIYNQQDLAAPKFIWLSLHTKPPGDDGAHEVSPDGASNYSRVDVTHAFSLADKAKVYNAELIQFATAGASWGEVTHYGLWTQCHGGELLDWGSLRTAKRIDAGDTASFPVNALEAVQTSS